MPRNDDFRIDSDNVVDDVETDDAVSESDGKAWPPAMEVKHAGFESGNDVEIKDASGDVAVTIEETSDPFKFRIIGGVTGLVDRVNDVVEVGAYTKTLKARTPKIIKDHEWSQRLGKVLSIKELAPGDPELPETVADGSPWPKTAGALVADVQLFKKSQAGQEAAERWREYGRDQQFSIGYRVPAGMAVKSKDGVRHIKELDLYEISDVLWGAAPDSTLLPSVLATKVLAGVELESKGVDPEDDEVEETADVEAVDDAVEDETGLVAEDEADQKTSETDDDDDIDLDAIEEVDMDDESIDAEAFDKFGDEVASHVTSDIERGTEPESAAPSTADAAEHTADTLTDVDPGSGDAPENEAAVDAVVDGNVGPVGDEPETAAPSTGDEVDQVAEKTLGAIESHVDLRAALRAYEASDEASKPVLAAYIVKSAETAGIGFMVPDEVRETAPEVKINTAPLGKPGNGKNWIEAVGGQLPAYIRGVARGLQENGHPLDRSIALAIGAVKRWASGGGNVKPDTRAKAIKAWAEWQALKAKAAAARGVKSVDPVDEDMPDTVEPVDTDVAESEAVEAPVDEEYATGSAERKAFTLPFFAGSWEERRSLLQSSLDASSEVGEFEGRASIAAMYDDYCIVTVWGSGLNGTDIGTYRVEYDYDDSDGSLELGKVQQVRITAKTTGDTDTDSPAEDGLVEVLGGMDADSSPGSDSVKAAVDMLNLENKAGRVLSAANAEALKSAYEALGDLLAKAGVDVSPADDSADDEVFDESDTDVKTDTLEYVPIEETDEYKMLQMVRLQVETRNREIRLTNGSI